MYSLTIWPGKEKEFMMMRCLNLYEEEENLISCFISFVLYPFCERKKIRREIFKTSKGWLS